ncbi:MAG: hypothetical protein N2442_04165 [Spirochaetes bacterium]|nr:hypothetical protein [Spirochaetota bacterium]
MDRILFQLYRYLSIVGFLFSALVFFYYIIGSFQMFTPTTQYFLLTVLYGVSSVSFWSGVNLLALSLVRGVLRMKPVPMDFLWGGIALVGGGFFLILTQFLFAFLRVPL